MAINPAAQQRALLAIKMMIDDQLGIMKAAKIAKTSRRTIHKVMKLLRIRTKMEKGKLTIIKSTAEKMIDFITYMSQGNSATKSAKMAKTTVRTMAKQTVDGNPIIVKEGVFWKLNAYPLYTHSMVIYGHIVGLDGGIQGQHIEEDGSIKSPNAPDIWWQIDFDEFQSTLPEEEVGEFYKDEIVSYLRDILEIPIQVNEVLTERFLGNDDVLADAISEGRVDADGNMLVTPLENILSRYQVKLYEYVNYGIDDNHMMRELGLISVPNMGDRVATGLFQIFFVKDEPLAYPPSGPLEIDFEYNLRDERF